MAIWPSDDPAISLSIRRALFPTLDGYSPNEVDFMKRSDPEAGPGHGQILDVWRRTRFVADVSIEARNRYAGILQAFWRANRANTFTFFDQDMDYHEGISLGTTTGVANQVFTLPFKGVEEAESTLYVNGSDPGSGNWTLLVGTGTEGADQIRLDYTPLADLPVTADLFGRRKYTCEFTEPPSRSSSGVDRKRVTYHLREY